MHHMGAPKIKEDARAANRMGTALIAVVTREGFPEEETSKHHLA